MFLGMLFGSWCAAQLSTASVAAAVLESFAGMTLE